MVQEQMRACDMLPKYAGVDARYQCTQFSWSEEFARPAAEVCAVVAQACRKHSYLIATTHFEPPLPFLVKARGMWATYYAGLTRTDNRISRTREMRRPRAVAVATGAGRKERAWAATCRRGPPRAPWRRTRRRSSRPNAQPWG